MQIKEFDGQRAASPQEVANILYAILNAETDIDQAKEHFWVIGVNTRNIIQYIELATLGTLNHSIIEARETFRLAIMRGVMSIIVAHNHPGGGLKPSPEDLQVTTHLCDSGKILNIKVLDHIIIGEGKLAGYKPYTSLKEEGIIK